ncbi:unnamed protein product [Parajaminaea phylloscopi]
MPPVGFNVAAAGNPNAIHVPKATQARLKDALARIRAALLGAQSENTSSDALKAANKAIDILLDDANVTPAPSSVLSEDAAWQLSRQIAQKFNAELVDVFLKEVDQGDRTKIAALVGILGRLGDLLGPEAIIMEWWDLVLRPILKDPAVTDKVASSARGLVVSAACAVPASAYKDEPEPESLWPPLDEKQSVRTAGDAPYPKTSTEPITKGQTSDRKPGGRRSLEAAARPTRPTDMHRRFVQRLFDLFVQEASSPLSTDEGDDEKIDALEQIRSSTSNLPADTSEDAAESPTDPSKKAYLWQALQPERLQPMDLAGTAWKGNLEAILITFGQERPKEFFHHLSASFEEPIHRIPILLLLTIFCRLNSIHSFHITSTRLINDIMLCLQLDTSTTLISLCITALIILIPQIPNWVAKGGAGGVPTLLSIFARIVDWRKLGPGWEHRLGDSAEMEAARRQHDEEFAEVERISKRLVIRSDIPWRRLESSVDAALAVPPDALRFFTIVYGLFPCNMIRFLRAPVDYLRRAQCVPLLDTEWEDLVDETSLQSRSEAILRSHILHPSIIEMTAEREITDKQRWLHHDAADTTAECISLSVESWHALSTDFPTAQDALSGSRASLGIRQPTHRSRSVGPSASRPPSPSPLRSELQSSGHGDADDILSSYADLRWGVGLSSGPASISTATSSSLWQRRSLSQRQMHRAATFNNNVGFRSASESPASMGRGLMPDLRLSSPAEAILHHQLDEAVKRTRQSAPTSPTKAEAEGVPRGRQHSTWTWDVSALRPRQHASRSASGASTGGAVMGVTEPSPASGASLEDQQNRAAKLEVYAELKYLQRENLLLRNEINFELYLKDQHLRHIGRLHRDRIKDSRLEAERQNLYQTVKLLRGQLTSISTAQERQRAEAATSKARHTQWENELNAKLKGYREDRKTWTAESRELNAQIESGRATIDAQAKRLQDAHAELFELQTELQRIGPKAAKVVEYEAKNAELVKCLVYWDEDVRKYNEQRREMEVLLSRWREMEMLVKASEEDRWKLSVMAEEQQTEIKKLKRELEAARKISAEPAPPLVDATDDTALPPSASPDGISPSALRKRVEALEAELLAYKCKEEMMLAGPVTREADGAGDSDGQLPQQSLKEIAASSRDDVEKMMGQMALDASAQPPPASGGDPQADAASSAGHDTDLTPEAASSLEHSDKQ